MNTNEINQFSIGADGTLSPLSPVAVASSYQLLSIAVDPSGKYVYVSNTHSDNITQYSISIDGTLSPLSPPAIATRSMPYLIFIDPSDKYV